MLYQEIKYLKCSGCTTDHYANFTYRFEELDILNYAIWIIYECAGESIIICPSLDEVLTFCNSSIYFEPECLFIPRPLSKNNVLDNSLKTKLLEQLWFELGSLENPTQRQIDWYITSINNLT